MTPIGHPWACWENRQGDKAEWFTGAFAAYFIEPEQAEQAEQMEQIEEPIINTDELTPPRYPRLNESV